MVFQIAGERVVHGLTKNVFLKHYSSKTGSAIVIMALKKKKIKNPTEPSVSSQSLLL